MAQDGIVIRAVFRPSSDWACAKRGSGAMAIEKSIASSSLAEVVDRILDKGVVIDAFVRVALVGIELLAVEARVVIASVETWLKYADAVGLVASPAEA
jgi:gas vesicle structural protein